MSEKMDYEKFFEEEWEKRFMEKVPCEEIEGGCDDKEEGTLMDGYRYATRLLIWVQDWNEVAFFRQEVDNEDYMPFELGEDIFVGPLSEIIPELAKTMMYPDDVVIFSEGKEIFSGELNIGEVIDKVIKERESLVNFKVNKIKEAD